MKDKLLAIIIIGIFLISFIIWLYFTYLSLKLQKRINKYSVNNKDSELSLLDKIVNYYDFIKDNFTKQLITLSKEEVNESVKLRYSTLACEIIYSISLSIIYLVLILITDLKFSIYLLVVFFILGILLPEFINYIKRTIRLKNLDKDLLKVISLMNNSFKSGKSIIQVIDTVIEEIDGPFKEEFIIIKKDIDNGLSISNSFERFYKRVNLEDLKPVITSLSILSNTGGDIVKVFSSIEDNIYIRKNLENELKAVVASSKLVFNTLVIFPIVLWILLIIGNINYYTCFFKSTLGIFIFIIILTIYILYILIIKRIMKIEKY